MNTTWLADAHPETFWPNHTWKDFAGMSAFKKKNMLVVIPVHGFADHGLGLPLDAEEAVGSTVLRNAVERANKNKFSLLVLPPVRFTLAPYPCTHFGLDAETAHEQLREIVGSVKSAGFSKIVFFNTSPWNEELVATVALDTRAELGLQNSIVNLSKLGISFHPGSSREARASAQAAAMHVLGLPAKQVRANGKRAAKADVRDADFRPGNFQQPTPLAPDKSLDGEAVLAATITHLARALADNAAQIFPSMHKTAASHNTDRNACAALRAHYLPAFTAAQLAAIPNKKNALVIISTGAIEQHGPHLPVGVDAILGQAWLAHALPKLSAKAARCVFVAPPIAFGKSNEHTGFPGTITISAKTLRRTLLALAAELKAMGFCSIAVLNTHGGNSPVIVYTLREIQTSLDMRAGMLKPMCETTPDMSEKEKALGFHAGQWETALMLACAPGLVRKNKIVCEYPSQPPQGLAWMTRDISKSGVMGDARAATQEQGKAWFEKSSRVLAKRIERLLDPQNLPSR